MKRASAILCGLLMAPSASALGQTDRFEIRAGALISLGSSRRATLATFTGEGSGTQTGGVISVQWRDYVAVVGRVFGGTFTPDSGTSAIGEVNNGNVDFVAGHPLLSARVGYGRRTFAGAFGRSSWNFARLGARSTIPLGPEGLTISLSGTIYVDVTGVDEAGDGSGREAEAHLIYPPPQVPLFYFNLGYRYEQFATDIPPPFGGSRPEEIGGIVVGAGLRLRL